MRDTKNGRLSKRPGSSSRVGGVRAAQLLRSRPRLPCAHVPAQQQAIIAGHIHAHARPAARLARSRQREARVSGMRVTERRRSEAELCCIQKMPERSGRRARSRFSSFFNVAAIGGKSPRAFDCFGTLWRRGRRVKRGFGSRIVTDVLTAVRTDDRTDPRLTHARVRRAASPAPSTAAAPADRSAASPTPPESA